MKRYVKRDEMTDWFRNEKWNKEIESNFFTKLKCARSQRDQYLYIQAATLNKHHPEQALKLINYYFDSRKEKFFDLSALLVKADAFLKLGKIKEAMISYRRALEREEDYPNVQSSTYVEYPYLVATQNIEFEYENALQILEKNADRMVFPIELFKWHAAKALINNDGKEALIALEAAKIKKSGFRFHQNLGVVGNEYKKTVKQLRKLSI